MNLVMNRTHALDNFFSNSNNTFFGRPIGDILAHNFFETLDADVQDEGNFYSIQLGVPGMTRKDISVEVDDSLIRVSGKGERSNATKNRMEFNRRSFMRSFVLPADAKVNSITAKCRNGLLVIRIEKVKGAAKRLIRVNGDNSSIQMRERFTSWWTRLTGRAKQLFR
jgi:HSP20 family protein